MDFLLMTEGCIDVQVNGRQITVPERFREVIAEAKLADEVGFDYFGCGEQHFDPPFWIISNPETMLAGIARETKRIKLRSTIFLLPFAHPLRMAEAIGTLDILSEGRLELGTGKGNNSIAMKAFEVPLDEFEERYLEALNVIKGALTHDVFSYHGKYYNFDEIPVLPKSLQRPHPPIYYAAASPRSHMLAAENGLGLMTLTSGLSADQVKKRFKIYQDNFVDGPGALRKVSIGVQTYCHSDSKKAKEIARPAILGFLDRAVFMYERTLQDKGFQFDFSNTKELIKNYESMIDTKIVAVGDPKEVIDTLQYYKELGADEIRIRADGMPHEHIVANIRMLADKVIPHFK